MMAPTPLRPPDEVAGGFLRVTLGGQPFELIVLPMSSNRKWIEELRATVNTVLSSTDSLEGVDDFIDLLATNSEAEMDLLIAYDKLGGNVLPEREWIDTHATDREVYEGVKRAAAAAFPKGPDLLRIAPQIVPALMTAASKGIAAGLIAMSSLRSTSSSQPSTAGPGATSTPTSPTSSSTSTSRKPRSAANRKPSPS